MAIDFPANMRPMIQAGMSRAVQPAFVQNNVAGGAMYIQSLHDNVPYIYDFNIVLSSSDALAFWAWFNDADYADKGRAEINMPVQMDGDYLAEQVCRFTESGIPQLVSVNGDARTYKCQVLIQNFDAGVTTADIMAEYEASGDDPSWVENLTYGSNVINPPGA